LPDFVDICRWFGGSDSLELVRPWLDSGFRETEAEVGDVCAAENTFFKINFDAMRDESGKKNVELSDVVRML
jgi:hypothetical protein